MYSLDLDMNATCESGAVCNYTVCFLKVNCYIKNKCSSGGIKNGSLSELHKLTVDVFAAMQ